MSNLHWMSTSELSARIEEKELRSVELVEELIKLVDRVDRNGPELRSVIEVNPDAIEIAQGLDALAPERRGLLHGIPILLKDNIGTKDRMKTTAGSLALENSRPKADAFVAGRLRDAGAILLGKANMSEWANFRSTHSTSGWSARGGQCRNPYALDRSPCGSSSGSAAAVAAGLIPVSLGSETDGSILCPGSMCGVVGVKPTVGLTSRSGVIPIAHTQDSVGPFARTVEDAALVLSVIAGFDPSDPASVNQTLPNYLAALDPGGLRGVRLGIPRTKFFGYSAAADRIAEEAIEALRDAGAEIVDPADFANVEEMAKSHAELTDLLFEFKDGINRYLSDLDGEGPRTLTELIAFNRDQAHREMPYFGQELFEQAEEKGPIETAEYVEARAEALRVFRDEGVDAVLREHSLDALIMPTTAPAFTIDLVNGDHFSGGCSGPAAVAGYPAITVPAGYAHGLPVGITFMGPAYSEAKLLRFAYAFEQAVGVFQQPEFLSSADCSRSDTPRPRGTTGP